MPPLPQQGSVAVCHDVGLQLSVTSLRAADTHSDSLTTEKRQFNTLTIKTVLSCFIIS